MITMVLGGLWHGAAWGFVLWGALHGAGLVVERFLRGRVDAPAWLRWAIVFNLVVFGWILFRAENLDLARRLHLASSVDPGRGHALDAGDRWRVVVGRDRLPAAAARPARAPAAAGGGAARLRARLRRSRRWWRWSALRCPSQGVPPFIYFQF